MHGHTPFALGLLKGSPRTAWKVMNEIFTRTNKALYPVRVYQKDENDGHLRYIVPVLTGSAFNFNQAVNPISVRRV